MKNQITMPGASGPGGLLNSPGGKAAKIAAAGMTGGLAGAGLAGLSMTNSPAGKAAGMYGTYSSFQGAPPEQSMIEGEVPYPNDQPNKYDLNAMNRMMAKKYGTV